MSFSLDRVDLLLQYALLLAGEEDDYTSRQLGPIHLIKYVYIADLAHAQRNTGKTFTDVRWQFYKFGPWAQEVNERIEPALLTVGADKKVFPSDYEEKAEWYRWSLRNEQVLRDKERLIPPAITIQLKRDVHAFGKDTPELLNYVYNTPPMLHAAPHELLDFSTVARAQSDKVDDSTLRMEALSSKKKKKFQQRMRSLKEHSGQTRRASTRLINPVSTARFDEVYEEGVAWLDSLAGDRISEGEKMVEFADDVWRSPTRSGDDVS